MLLNRVEVDPDSTFFVLNTGIAAFQRLSRLSADTHRNKLVQQALEALQLAAKSGWFYVNPRNEDQLIAYCGLYGKPFWLVVAPGNRDGFKHIEKDYVVITALGHRASRFAEAIAEHKERIAEEGSG